MTRDSIHSYISQADADDIDYLLTALHHRYQELFPDWEICFFSLPKANPGKRALAVDEMLRFIQKYGK